MQKYSKAYCYNHRCENKDYELVDNEKGGEVPECPECGEKMQIVAEVIHSL